MDFALLLIIGVGALVLVIKFVIRSSQTNRSGWTQNGIPICPPHKWIYDHKQELFCDKCKNRPGSIHSNYDKPY